MTKSEKKGTVGRPRILITAKDREQVSTLARIGCTPTEIAAVIGKGGMDWVKDRFAQEIADGHEHLKMNIRRMQFKRASTGNTGMLIWMGKQYLGQTDKVDLDTTATVKVVFSSDDKDL